MRMANDDEKLEFQSLSKNEQKSIIMLLEAAGVVYKNFSVNGDMTRWFSCYNEPLVMAAWSTFATAEATKEKLQKKCVWGNEEIFYGEAIKMGAFCIRCDLIKTFVAFKFLFVRLFGGDIIPYVTSLFLASISHPTLCGTISRTEVEKSLLYSEEGWAPVDPKFYPDINFILNF